jgi:hypothetical protein
MDSLFGGEVPGAARFIIAFVVVLLLIGILAWLVRRFGSGALSSSGARGRQPRLAVIDAASVDARRRLILVRRDNVEHLLMIGGPTDIVVEPNIVRAAAAARDLPAMRTPPMADAMPRPVALDEGTMWPLQPQPEPARPQRPANAAAAPQWSAAPPPPTEPVLRAPHPDPTADHGDVPAEHAPRAPEVPSAARPPEPELQDGAQYATPASDQNLAEMAQRLEAALRRPLTAEPRLDIPADAPPAAHMTSEAAPLVAVPSHEPDESAAPPVRPQPRPAPSKNFYESLEQEMASLLGRPPGKT